MSKIKEIPVPKLKKIDLSRGKESKHPDLKTNKVYLIKWSGNWYAGQFTKEWFGWSFDGWDAPLQFDTPGTNSSRWEAIFEIIS